MHQQIERVQPSKYGDVPLRHALQDFKHDDRGVSAVEFALLAPMLLLSLLSMVDLGMALSERMAIGHVVRAGAQAATVNVSEAAVDLVMRTTAAKNMTLVSNDEPGDDTLLALETHRIFICAEQPTVQVDPFKICADEKPTQIFYILSGSKIYSGLILPRFSLSKQLLVQTR